MVSTMRAAAARRRSLVIRRRPVASPTGRTGRPRRRDTRRAGRPADTDRVHAVARHAGDLRALRHQAELQVRQRETRTADVRSAARRARRRPPALARAGSRRPVSRSRRRSLRARGRPRVPVRAARPDAARDPAKPSPSSHGQARLPLDDGLPPAGAEYVAYWALDDAEERVAFERIVDRIMAMLAERPGMHVYHYAAYEPTALKRLAARHATREAEVDVLLRGGRLRRSVCGRPPRSACRRRELLDQENGTVLWLRSRASISAALAISGELSKSRSRWASSTTSRTTVRAAVRAITTTIVNRRSNCATGWRNCAGV